MGRVVDSEGGRYIHVSVGVLNVYGRGIDRMVRISPSWESGGVAAQVARVQHPNKEVPVGARGSSGSWMVVPWLPERRAPARIRM